MKMCAGKGRYHVHVGQFSPICIFVTDSATEAGICANFWDERMWTELVDEDKIPLIDRLFDKALRDHHARVDEMQRRAR